MKRGERVMHDVTMKRGQTLEAQVIDAVTGNALAGTQVTLRKHPSGPGQASSAFTGTNAHGVFVLPYVPRQAYSLELERRGYESKIIELDLQEGPLPAPLSMRPARVLEIRFLNLPENAKNTTATCSLSRFGPPQPGAPFLSVSAEGTFSAEGVLSIDAPPPGRYQFTMFRSKHLPRLTKMIQVPEGALKPIEWPLPKTSMVIGVLLDAKGEPMSGSQVRMGVSQGGLGGGSIANAKTDPKGRFQLADVPEGTHPLQVRAGEAWVNVGAYAIRESGTTEIRAQAPGSSTLRMRWLVGEDPVALWNGMATIRKSGATQPVAEARPSQSGEMRIQLLAPGRYEIWMHANDSLPRVLRVSIGEGEAKELGDVVSMKLARVPIRLEGIEDAEHLKRVRAVAFDPAQERLDFSTAVTKEERDAYGRAYSAALYRGSMKPAFFKLGSDGNQWLEGVPTGKHRLEIDVMGSEYKRTVIHVDIKHGMTEPIVIRMQK